MKLIKTLTITLFLTVALNNESMAQNWQLDPAGFIYNTNSGVVGIGTANPDTSYKLSVNGKVRAKEIKVEAAWSDFVFAEGYELMSLASLEKFIKRNRRLPDIPSEAEVSENGVAIGEMHSKLLQKIEELTLYVIELNWEGEELEKQLSIFEKKAVIED